MGILSLDVVRPGMILARDVKDRKGRVLLGQESEISEKHIKIFKKWGVMEVDVLGQGEHAAPGDPEAPLDPRAYDRARARTEELFRFANLEHPAVRELHRLITTRVARTMPHDSH